jgi:peptidoglycan/LPS O-acetylase OafA/YrhL
MFSKFRALLSPKHGRFTDLRWNSYADLWSLVGLRREEGQYIMTDASTALSNLRAVVIVIVVAFHSSLAYLSSAPTTTAAFDSPPYSWQAFPILDPQRWLGFDLFCIWQDLGLMSSMFFLSGLFAAGSLKRKGSRTYASDRLWRIGLPFLVGIAVLSPISFFPAYIVRTADPSLYGYWSQLISLPFLPSGPQWFLWQLLVANLLGAALYFVWPGLLEQLSRLAGWGGRQPLKFVALMIATSALAYVPLAYIYSPWSWSVIGPFSVQLCRPAHYVVYFFAGLALGSHGLDRGLLACDGPLARRWWAWWIATIVSAGAWAGLMWLTTPDWSEANPAILLIASLSYPVACACGGLTLLALCLRFAGGVRFWVLDSLSANAYSIYLIHYMFVVWLQYALLGSGLIAPAKAAIVLAVALTASWLICVGYSRLVAGPNAVAAKRVVSSLPQ